MWYPLDRARRRLLDDSPVPPSAVDGPPLSAPVPVRDVVLAIGRIELDRLVAALERAVRGGGIA